MRSGTRWAASQSRPWAPAALALVSGLAVTGLVTWRVATSVDARERMRFASAVQRTEDAIRRRMETCVGLLRGGTALFAVGGDVSRRTFRTYVSRLEIPQRYPGLQGIGFSRRLRPGEERAVVARTRAQGLPGFRLWPRSDQAERHAILYLEPLDRGNAAALGFDMFGHPVRRAAMEGARDTASAAASGRITPVEEVDPDNQAGFLIFLPVYRGGEIPRTVTQRRERLLGFVYSPFRAGDLFAGLFGSESHPLIHLRIYDGIGTRPEQLLHRSDAAVPPRPAPTARFTAVQTLRIDGRPWTVVFTRRSELPTVEWWEVPQALATGFVISLLLFAMVAAQTRARQEAEAAAAELEASEAEARAQREQWRTTLASIGDAVVVTDREGRVTFLNPVAEALTGWTPAEAVGQPLGTVFHVVDAASRERARDPAAEVLRTGRTLGVTANPRLVRRDGTECPIDDSGAPIRDQEGTATGAVVVFRDVTQRATEEGYRELEHQITAVLAEARTLEEAAPRLLCTICVRLGFAWGAVWQVDVAERVLRCGRQWHADEASLDTFETRSRSLALACGEGLPGRAWASRRAEWIPNTQESDSFPRAPAAAQAGLQSGAALPIILGGDVVGVIELFSREQRPEEPELLEFLAGVGTRLGLFAERLRAEEAFQAGSALMSAIVKTATACVITIDHHDQILEWNPAAERTFGYPRAAAVGANLAKLVIPERFRESHYRGMARFLETGEGPVLGKLIELPALRADGSEFPAELSIVAIRTGGRLLFTAHLRDVSEARRAERALRESEERFRLMADSAPVLIWISDTANRGAWFNRPWLEFTGRTREQELGQGWAECVHPDDRARCVEHCTAAFHARQAFTMEFRLRRYDGAWRWVLDTGVPLNDAGGDFSGYIGSCIDITERRTAEEGLRDAMRHKDEFLAMLAHELRNPLGAMNNALEVMHRSPADSPAFRRAQETTARQIAHQARMVNDLLDVSRLAHGKLDLRREPLDLARLIAETAQDYRDLLTTAGLTLTVRIPAEPVPVLGDRTRLAQVTANLLDNACKFTPRGGAIEVSVEPEATGGSALVRVRDTGIGVEAELVPRLFEPFSQADRTLERTRGGLGLGLALVKGLVELHGGAVAADSAGAGAGTVVILRLPLHAAAPYAAAPVPEPGEPHRPLRVLVVEDNVDAADTLRDLLELHGHEVHLAHTGPAGIEAALRLLPEVVLCDIGLPGMSGYDLAAAVRSEPTAAGMRLIAVTGYGSREDRSRSQAAGFDAHLTKPIDLGELEGLLTAAE